MVHEHKSSRHVKSHQRRFAVARVVALLVLAIGLSITIAASNAHASNVPTGGIRGKVLWIVAELLSEFVEDLFDSDDDERTENRTEDEALEDQGHNAGSAAIAEFFEIESDEYRNWPKQWKNVLREVHSTPENFKKRTIHTLKMLDASDWILLENMASYALGGHLLAEGFFEAKLIGIAVDDQIELETIGVINSGDTRLQMVLKPRSERELYRSYVMGDYGLILWFRNHTHEAARTAARVTSTGRELLRLLQVKPRNNHLHQLGVSFAQDGIRTEFWKIVKIPGTKQFRLDEKIWEVLPKS